jgi:rhamnulokinase
LCVAPIRLSQLALVAIKSIKPPIEISRRALARGSKTSCHESSPLRALIAFRRQHTMSGMSAAYIAIDLGAESGRVIVGLLAQGLLRLEEVHRFTHEPVWLPTGLHWDTTGIWREIVVGLRRAAEWANANKIELVSVGVDTWGVDWALVDEAGELVGLPHAYRDSRNPAAYEQVLASLGAERIYQTTGIQFMPLNTLYSLYAHHLADPAALTGADQLLFMPDLFHFWLSGERTTEATIASTSQMVDCHTGDWAWETLGDLGLPTDLLGPITPAGSTVGTLLPKLAEITGLSAGLRVVAPAAHDTASAVAAVPATAGTSWCYLSSGTWSLLGAEIEAPCVSPEAQAASFTNELGVGGTFRFLKNITGLWLVQECRRDLARSGQEFDYPELMRLARDAPAFRTLLDPAHAPFQSAGDMRQKIADFARATDQDVPESPGQLIRACLESLALAYREKLNALQSILDRRFDVVHIVGGGGKNELLCQMTADACHRPVVVGPIEATAMGNVLVQAMTAGQIRDLPALRQVVAASCEPKRYDPSADWTAAYERFASIVRRQ